MGLSWRIIIDSISWSVGLPTGRFETQDGLLCRTLFGVQRWPHSVAPLHALALDAWASILLGQFIVCLHQRRASSEWACISFRWRLSTRYHGSTNYAEFAIDITKRHSISWAIVDSSFLTLTLHVSCCEMHLVVGPLIVKARCLWYF